MKMRTFIGSLVVAACALSLLATAAAEELQPAVDFSLNDLQGQQVQLSSFKGKQSVLLFFWTSWCPYCLKEIKALNEKRQAFEARNIQILAVNSGESKAVAQRLVKNYSISLRVLLDEDGRVSDAYHVLGVPTLVLIDKSGLVRFTGHAEPKEEIESLP
jgi:peroxiredoxin